MQTFLSEPTTTASAAVLDNVRLQCQYKEGMQILGAIAITPEGGGQRVDGKVPFASNHPATNMWRGHEKQLYYYLDDVRVELDRRGIKTSTIREKLSHMMGTNPDWILNDPRVMPAWWTNEWDRDRLMTTHRANLYNKDNVHYAQYKVDALILDKYLGDYVCCPGKHAPYYYPTHTKEYA